MGVTINSLYRMDGYSDKHYGSVTHNGHTFAAVLVGPFERLESILHTEVTAEYELNEIIAAETGLERDDSVSGIFALGDGQLAIDGSIHNETKIDDRLSVLDIYIQNGADFLAITSEDLGRTPAVGSRIRLRGKGLRVYPTFT
jgi:hypothetical protein